MNANPKSLTLAQKRALTRMESGSRLRCTEFADGSWSSAYCLKNFDTFQFRTLKALFDKGLCEAKESYQAGRGCQFRYFFVPSLDNS